MTFSARWRTRRSVRAWIWFKLITLADRIAPEEAFRLTGMNVYLDVVSQPPRTRGWRLDNTGTRGVPVWYYGPDYERRYE